MLRFEPTYSFITFSVHPQLTLIQRWILFHSHPSTLRSSLIEHTETASKQRPSKSEASSSDLFICRMFTWGHCSDSYCPSIPQWSTAGRFLKFSSKGLTIEAFLNKVTRPQACPRRHVAGLVKGMIDLMSEIDKESLPWQIKMALLLVAQVCWRTATHVNENIKVLAKSFAVSNERFLFTSSSPLLSWWIFKDSCCLAAFKMMQYILCNLWFFCLK